MRPVIQLSDEELHDELLEHGINTPVTATTRSLMRKKLELARKANKLKKRKAANKAPVARSLQSFSSDEEQQEQEEEEKDVEEEEEYELVSNRSYNNNRSNNNNNSSSSRSGLFRYNTDVITRHTSSPLRASTPASLKKKTFQIPQSASRSTPHERSRLSYEYDSTSDVDDLLPRRARHYDSMLDGTTPEMGESSVSRRDFRYSPRGDLDHKTPSYRYSEMEHVSNGHVGTKRCKSNSLYFNLSSWPFVSYFYRKKPYKVTREGNFGGASPYFPSPPSPPPPLPEPEDKEGAWCPSVSSVLLLLLTLFFLLLGMTYVRLMPPSGGLLEASIGDDTPAASQWDQFAGRQLEENGLKLPICPASGSSSAGSGPAPSLCLSQSEVVVAPHVLGAGRAVVREAERRHAEYQCGGRGEGHLTVDELQRLLASEVTLEEDALLLGVSVLAKLSALNPSLGLEPVLAPSEGGAGAPGTWEGRALQGLRVRTPRLQLLCALMNVASLGLAAAALTALGCAVFYGVLWGVRRLQRRRLRRQQQVYGLVRRVVGAVRGRGVAPLHHVRDDLLSPEERLLLGGVWRDAVAFIDRHESRLVREVRVVGGEECEVWRWIGGDSNQSQTADDGTDANSQSRASAYDVTDVTSQSRANAHDVTDEVGQSRAGVDGVTDAVNQSRGSRAGVPDARPPTQSLYPTLPTLDDDGSSKGGRWWRGVGEREAAVCAPTSCLKIRNLARPSRPASWVREAVLRKCAGLPVLHLAVDQHGPEGLVYLMADCVETAGKIHSLLHGQWFEGQLVSVKFLRRERYCERFPAAPHCTSPLTPN